MRSRFIPIILSLAAAIGGAVACLNLNETHYYTPKNQCCPDSGKYTHEECCDRGCYVGGNPGPGSHNQFSAESCELYNGTAGTDMTDPTMGDTAGLTLMTMEGGSAADSGGECEPTEAEYACHGWVAGVYRRKTNPTGSFTFMNSTNPPNAMCVGGNDSIKIVDMFQGFDASGMEVNENEHLFGKCRDACDQLIADGQWTFADFTNPDPAIWDQHKIVCVMWPSSNNGIIPDGYAGIPGGHGESGAVPELCSWVGASSTDVEDGDPVQITYEGPAPDDLCADAPSCTGWQPSAQITHSLSGTTHTATIDDALVLDLLDDGWRTALECDQGAFAQINTTGTTQSWKMWNLASGDLWYSMGFRTGDYDLKIKKTVGGTYINLDSYIHMADAFDLLYPQETALTVQAKRPCVGTCFPTTHTWNITIN